MGGGEIKTRKRKSRTKGNTRWTRRRKKGRVEEEEEGLKEENQIEQEKKRT